MNIVGNKVGCYSPMGKTFILTDENGNEFTGVVVEQETIFTATDNDVRDGRVYANSAGVSTGTKTIPGYHTSYGYKIVLAHQEMSITVPEYDYENLFVVVTTYNNDWKTSLSSTYVAIDNGMYAVGSATKISDIVVDHANHTINLGITASEKSVVRYVITREEF